VGTEKWQRSLDWLLEPEDLGVQYLTMRDLTGASGNDLLPVKKKAHAAGPIAEVLEKMKPAGYWEQSGPGYYPKYYGTIWSVILLSQLGADTAMDARIEKAVSYVLDHSLTAGGQFTINGKPSGTADCLQGNLCEALTVLGSKDTRLDKAVEWMARTVTGDGIAPMADKNAPLRYYAGKCGPNFACGANNKLPCAWGATKVMLAFGSIPAKQRTPLVDDAIKTGIDFLFSKDPAQADYPSGWATKPSGNWWKFGFPLFYITDLLQIAEALAGLGYARDPRLVNAINLIRDKQDADGRWPLEYDYAGKIAVDFGPKKQPNKWVTLRAMRVLKTQS
jgi:hypothetical protein